VAEQDNKNVDEQTYSTDEERELVQVVDDFVCMSVCMSV